VFKYYIKAWVEDTSGYYVGSEQVTNITVYADSAKQAEEKTMNVIPEKRRHGRDWKWIIRIDKIEETIGAKP